MLRPLFSQVTCRRRYSLLHALSTHQLIGLLGPRGTGEGPRREMVQVFTVEV